MDRLGTLFQLHLPVRRMLPRPACFGLRWRGYGVAFDRDPVGVLDGAQAGGHPGLAGGDGLAVAPAVGALREALAEVLDFADVGFSFAGVRGDGEQGGVGGGGVQDEADGLALGVAAGQRDDPGAVGFWPGWLGLDRALPDR